MLFGCFDSCAGRCDKEKCTLTCPFNEPEYSFRIEEVNGTKPLKGVVPRFAEEDIPPLHLPMIYGHTARKTLLDTPWVAVPFHRLFREIGGKKLEPVVSSPTELRANFCLAPKTRIVAISAGYDRDLERMWEYHRVVDMAAALKSMGVTLATALNFSFWVLAPRMHNEWNYRRMALFTLRMWEGGFPTVPHIYAETDADWLNRAAFFIDHPQLDSFAFEFQTADAVHAQSPRLRQQMEMFMNKVGRPLRIIASGGGVAANWITQLFSGITIVESNSYMRAIKRRPLFLNPQGKIKAGAMLPVKVVDDLLHDNICTTENALKIKCAMARGQTEKTEKAAAQGQ